MENPSNLKYTRDHEWIKVDGTTALVGITHFAQSELGEIVFIELPSVGKQLAAKDQLCVVESTKAASDVYSPIAGKVAEVNSALNDNPAAINSDPYQSGWIAKLSNFDAAELNKLMSKDEYEKFLTGV